MAKDKVVIRWDTKCAWNGKEQPIARKTIDPPSPANLVAGQKVRVKFSGRWYDAFVVTLERKSRDRPTRTPNVVFVVASHYQSLQIIVLLLQACLLEIYLFCKI